MCKSICEITVPRVNLVELRSTMHFSNLNLNGIYRDEHFGIWKAGVYSKKETAYTEEEILEDKTWVETKEIFRMILNLSNLKSELYL